MTRVEERAALRPAFFTSAATDSIGSPISDAAISACSLWSSVMPAAAKIASSNVGGSRRTRRGPYLVFQSWLIAHLCFGERHLRSAMLHCNMKLVRQSSYGGSRAEMISLDRRVGFASLATTDGCCGQRSSAARPASVSL